MEPSSRTPTRVLVVDDHAPFAEALRRLLERQPGVRLVGSARDVEEAMAMLVSDDVERPEVVLMDLDRPGGDGVSATRRIRARSPGVKVVALTATQDPEVIADAIAAGACGYVPKTRAVDHLLDVIRRAAAGELVLPERDLAPVLQRLRDSAVRSEARAVLGRLTTRETDILRALAAGDSTSQISERFGITALTVQSHVKNILAKLGVHSKIEAVTMAWRLGLAPATKPS